ncbi:MAG: P-loop NTPase fold protein, partial [Imperialibacter sp.]
MAISEKKSIRLVQLDWAYYKKKLSKLKKPEFWAIFSLIVFSSYLSIVPVKVFVAEHILIQLPPNSATELCIISILLIGILLWLMIALGWKRYFIKKAYIIIYLYLSITWWLYFRNIEEWIPLQLFGIALLDILYCIPVGYLLSYFSKSVFSKLDYQPGQSKLLEDLEKETLDPEADQVRYHYANEIAIAIQGQRFNKAFAVAVEGPWGSGKTSFVNTVIKNLNKQTTLTILFNPINYESEDLLIKGFLKELEKLLTNFDDSVGSQIDQYIGLLTSFSPSSFQSTINFLRRPGSAIDSYDKINKAIERLGKQIIIVIDDLDRLNKDEIMAVLKLIRNTANFFNCCYIVPFDKNYLQKELPLGSSHEFYEKYFQFEFYLPRIYEASIEKDFIEKVDRLLDGCTLYNADELERAISNPTFHRNI